MSFADRGCVSIGRHLFARFASLLVAVVSGPNVFAQATDSAMAFEKVREVIAKRCVTCHGRGELRGGLDLRSEAAIAAGSTSGPVLVRGEPEASLLYTLTAHLETPRMPPGQPRIPERELKIIHDWIASLETESPKPSSPMPVAGKPLPKIVPIEEWPRPTALADLAISRNGQRLAIPGRQQVIVFEGSPLRPVRAFPFPEGEICALTFSADGKKLVAGGGLAGESGLAVIFDAETGERLVEIEEPGDAILTVDVSGDGRWLALGGPGKTVALHDLEYGREHHRLTGPTDWVLSTAFSPDGLLVAGGDRFGGVRVWETRTGKEFWTLRGHTGPIHRVIWSPSADELLSGSDDGSVRIWDMHRGEQRVELKPGLDGLLDADWHPDGRIAVAGRSGTTAILTRSGEIGERVKLSDEAAHVRFLGESDQLLTADALGALRIHSGQDATMIGEIPLPIASVAVANVTDWPRRERARPPKIVQPAVSETTSQDELLQAIVDAEKAIATAEEAVSRLKETAARLKKIAAEQSR